VLPRTGLQLSMVVRCYLVEHALRIDAKQLEEFHEFGPRRFAFLRYH
jgi:hypothetical protein